MLLQVCTTQINWCLQQGARSKECYSLVKSKYIENINNFDFARQPRCRETPVNLLLPFNWGNSFEEQR